MSKGIAKSFWFKLLAAPILMFGFAYLMVPIYDVLCDITGFGGRTGRINSINAQASVIDESRKVQVEFLSMTMAGFNVGFKPVVTSMDVVPGKVYKINYIAENRTDKEVTGQAVPSVAPAEAALNFKKIECFCFSKQTFKPHSKVEMPVTFVVQTDLDDDVKNITLSYNFFKIKE